MFAFAHTLLAPSMALALVILGFQLVMGLRAATLRDVLLVRLPSPWMHSASPPVLHEKAVGRKAGADALGRFQIAICFHRTTVDSQAQRKVPLITGVF